MQRDVRMNSHSMGEGRCCNECQWCVSSCVDRGDHEIFTEHRFICEESRTRVKSTYRRGTSHCIREWRWGSVNHGSYTLSSIGVRRREESEMWWLGQSSKTNQHTSSDSSIHFIISNGERCHKFDLEKRKDGILQHSPCNVGGPINIANLLDWDTNSKKKN